MTWTETSSPTFCSGNGASIGSGLDRADIATNQHGDQTGANTLASDQDDVGRLHHRVSGFNSGDETLRLHHSQGFLHSRLLRWVGGPLSAGSDTAAIRQRVSPNQRH
jgi:hypothetical protein